MESTIRFLNVFSGSLMIGGFVFGAVTVARAHVAMPPPAAWEFHRFVSRRVDWFIPFSALLATITGWLLLVVDGSAAREAQAMTFLGALLLTTYGPPFLVHPTGLRNELAFVRSTADRLSVSEMRQRMRWWNLWHYYRTVVGGAAQACYVVAALWR